MKTIKNRTAYGIRFYVRINKVFQELEGVHTFNFPFPRRSVSSVQFLNSDTPKAIVGDYAPEEFSLECYFDYSNSVHVHILSLIYSGDSTMLRLDFPTGHTCTIEGVFFDSSASSSVSSADSIVFSFIPEKKPVWSSDV